MVYEKPNWDANPPKHVGQRRYYNAREYNPARACGKCAGPFWPRRGQSRLCDGCRSCRSCAAKLPDPLRFDLCRRCRPLTSVQRAQLRRLHDGMFGQNNPAKKPGVGAKISAAISGDNHPAKKNPEWYSKHAHRIRPKKVSKLEDLVATLLPKLERQYKVRYRLRGPGKEACGRGAGVLAPCLPALLPRITRASYSACDGIERSKEAFVPAESGLGGCIFVRTRR